MILRTFVDILVPVFLVVGVGWALGPRLGIDHRPLARAAYVLLAPAFIFDALSAAPLDATTVARFVGVLLIGMAAAALFAVAAGRLVGADGRSLAALVLVAVYGNVGNFGLPIVLFRFGDEALADAALAMVTVNTVGFFLGVLAGNWATTGPGTAFRRAATSPVVVAAVLAIALNASGATLPLFAGRAIGVLAAGMIPVMLLTLGIQLATMRSLRPTVEVAIGSVSRLVVAPLGAALAATAIGLSGRPAGVAIVQSAMPAAVLTSLIAIEHDLHADRITTTVLVSTVLSAATLSVVLSLV